MKTLHLLSALTLGLAAGYGSQQDDKQALAQEVELLQARVQNIENYLVAQANAEKAVSEAIDRAVEEGFTVGINFKAREILVQAWKERAKTAQQGLPKKKEPAKAVDPRLLRRSKH